MVSRMHFTVPLSQPHSIARCTYGSWHACPCHPRSRPACQLQAPPRSSSSSSSSIGGGSGSQDTNPYMDLQIPRKHVGPQHTPGNSPPSEQQQIRPHNARRTSSSQPQRPPSSQRHPATHQPDNPMQALPTEAQHPQPPTPVTHRASSQSPARLQPTGTQAPSKGTSPLGTRPATFPSGLATWPTTTGAEGSHTSPETHPSQPQPSHLKPHVPNHPTQLDDSLYRLHAILTYHAMDSSYPGPHVVLPAVDMYRSGTEHARLASSGAPPEGLAWQPDATQESADKGTVPTTNHLYNSGLRTATQRVLNDNVPQHDIMPLYLQPGQNVLADMSWSDGKQDVRGSNRKRGERGEPPTVGQIVTSLHQHRPDLFDTPVHEEVQGAAPAAAPYSTHITTHPNNNPPSDHNSSVTGGRQPTDTASATIASIQASVREVFASHNVPLDAELINRVVWMATLGCLATDVSLGATVTLDTPRPSSMPIVPAHGVNTQIQHGQHQQVASDVYVYLSGWLSAVCVLERTHPGLQVLDQLSTHFHLLLRTPAQVESTLSSLKILLGPEIGPRSHNLVTLQPHLLWKSAKQLECDLEEIMDVTQVTPQCLVRAIAHQPAILSHHNLGCLLTRWSHLAACVTPSHTWRQQLDELSGPGLALAMHASYSMLDGLQYMQERPQDKQYTLTQALELVSSQGLARRFRRWRQRHLLRGQWHSLHQHTATVEAAGRAHPDSSVWDGAIGQRQALAQACVLQHCEQQLQERALRDRTAVAAQEQHQHMQASLRLVQRQMQRQQQEQQERQ